MPTLVSKLPEGDLRYELRQMVTSIGHDADCDIRIEHESIKPRHAHVVRDRADHRVFAAAGVHLHINGERKREHLLADGDQLQVGDFVFGYWEGAVPESDPAPTPRPGEDTALLSAGYGMLVQLSRRFARPLDLIDVERTVVDAMIEITGSDRGLLYLLAEEGAGHIDVARDRSGRDMVLGPMTLDDRVVEEVVDGLAPVIIQGPGTLLSNDDNPLVRFDAVTYLAAPVIAGDAVLGIVCLGLDHSGEALSTAMKLLLEAAGAQCGAHLQQAIHGTRPSLATRAPAPLTAPDREEAFIATSRRMQSILQKTSSSAALGGCVLITGEPGAGKTALARELHRLSDRALAPFVVFDAAAIPASRRGSALQATLRSAGARPRPAGEPEGSRVAAGTVFIEELTEVPLDLQDDLLDVIETSGDDAAATGVRIVAATRMNIDLLRQGASLQPELLQYFATSVIPLPPLRERREEIPVLARHFASLVCARQGRPLADFTRRATATMRYHEWPENVRELRRRIEEAIVTRDALLIDAPHLGLDAADLSSIVPLLQAKESFALEYILDVLDLNGGNKSKTARDLEVDPRTIFRYIEGK